METEEPVWTKTRLQTLLGKVKEKVPKRMTNRKWSDGMKALDWKEVAFEPFTPGECQQKCEEIFQKMRKLRSLTELIDEAEDAICHPSRNRKSHPELPKRTCSAYAIFLEENKDKFRQQHPEMYVIELMRYASRKYKKLPDKEKQKYVKKFNLAQKKHKTSMMAFRRWYDPTHKRTKEPTVTEDSHHEEEMDVESALPPKSPTTGYILFCKEQSSLMGDIPSSSYVTVWAQRWRNLTNSQKSEYARRCKEMKNEYEDKLRDFLKDLDEETRRKIIQKYQLKQYVVPENIPGEPKMPIQNPSALFYQEQMKITNSTDCSVTVKWGSLPQKEREQYRSKVNENINKYSVALQKWFKALTPTEQKAYRARNPTKRKFLKTTHIPVCESNKVCDSRPSDSEDEDTEDSDSDEDEMVTEDGGEEEEEEEEEEEVEGGDMFEMY